MGQTAASGWSGLGRRNAPTSAPSRRGDSRPHVEAAIVTARRSLAPPSPVLRRPSHCLGIARARAGAAERPHDQSRARAPRPDYASARSGYVPTGRRIRPCAPSGRDTCIKPILWDRAFCAGPCGWTNLHSVNPATGRCGVQQSRQPQQSTHVGCALGHLVAAGHPRLPADRQRDGLLWQSRPSARAGSADPAVFGDAGRAVVHSPPPVRGATV